MKRRALRRILRDMGFDEAINFSFIDTAHDDEFELLPGVASDTGKANFVTLSNPILEDATRMRATLLPGLIESLRNNLNHGTRDVRLFEIGRIFASLTAGELPLERDSLALIATGSATDKGRAQASKEIDFYELKGAVEAAIDAMKIAPLGFSKAKIKHLREGQAAEIMLADGTAIGSIGRLSETIAASYKFRQPVYLAELDLTALLDSEQRTVQYKPLPRYPSVVRDLTLLVGRDISFAELIEAVDSERVADCSGAKLVGTYEGEGIPENQRSVTLRIEYRSEDGTLRDEEVEERHRSLIDSLLIKFSAKLH
jgi:phenylalanyl-tRNA synthetase beta chain